MLKAAEMARPLGGALALLCAFAAGVAEAEAVRPALKPLPPAELSAAMPAAVEEPSAAATLASVSFAPTEMELGAAAKRDLAELARRLRGEPDARIAVIAYAAAAGATMSARRISLGRALAVRSYLLGEGVARRRMIVRALGASEDAGASERVDIQWLAQ